MANTLSIFVVEDERQLVKIIKKVLEKAGFQVDSAADGDTALKLLQQTVPHLLILDLMIPQIDGLTLCKTLRQNPIYNQMPILIISALSRPDDVIKGLDAGADDYLTKPFYVEELQARVRALLRRHLSAEKAPNSILIVGNLVLDSVKSVITTHQGVHSLTATELRLLRYLMERPNQVISSTQLLEDIWEYPSNAGDTDLVRAHIRKLRQKIEPNSRHPQHIQTIHGVGYKLIAG